MGGIAGTALPGAVGAMAAATAATTGVAGAAAGEGPAAEGQAVIPEGYVLIPGGKITAGYLKGRVVEPFMMKATPFTNAEWFRVIEGQPIYVLLKWNQKTDATKIQDIFKKAPTTVDAGLNLDGGDIQIKGAQVLLKLVANPSRVYDKIDQVFSDDRQPVVGVSYLHTLALLLIETLKAGGKLVYGLPTGLQYGYVASGGGVLEYGPEVNQLVAADGLFGVQTIGGVWRWIRANRKQHPYGLRGMTWYDVGPEGMRAVFRNLDTPAFRDNNVGFSPVALPGRPTVLQQPKTP